MNYLQLVLSICLLHYVSAHNLTAVSDCKWIGSGVILDLSKTTYFEYYDTDTFASYRYYPCKASVSWGSSTCQVEDGPALCQQNSDSSLYMVGTLASVSVTSLTSDTFEMSYTGGYFGRNGTVTITCFQTTDNFKFDSENYPAYFFSLSLSDACTNGAASGGEDAGFVLFILLILAGIFGVTAYIVGGVAFMYLHKKERGLALVPNLAFWKDFPFLFRDGFLFTFSCIPKVREYFVSKVASNYEKIPS